jgi:hypothetical protein
MPLCLSSLLKNENNLYCKPINLGKTISSCILDIGFLKKPLAEVRRDEGM